MMSVKYIPKIDRKTGMLSVTVISDARVQRILQSARLYLEPNMSIRKVARLVDTSKSTVFNDLKRNLRYVNKGLYSEVRAMRTFRRSGKYPVSKSLLELV